MNIVVDQNTGGIAMWSNVCDVPRHDVLDAATKAGIERHVPAQPPFSTTLRDSMEDVAKSLFAKRRNEPIQLMQTAASRTFECVRCVRGAADNDHRFLFSAEIDATGQVNLLKLSDINHVTDHGKVVWAQDLSRILQDAVVKRLTILPGPVVTKVIAAGLRDWGGQSLISRGGVWFFPASCRDKYVAWCERLKPAGICFTHVEVQVSRNPDFVDHLLTELTNEVGAGLKDIQSDIMNGTATQDRSVNLRIERTQEFLCKITQYEEITGRTMGDLRRCVDAIKSSLSLQRMVSRSA